MKVDFSNYDKNNQAFGASIGASKFKQLLWFMCSPLFIRNPFIPFSGFRKWILIKFGAEIGIEARIRPDLCVHHPRPVGGFPHQQPDRGDVSRQGGGDGACRGSLQGPIASVHTRAPLGGA